MQNQAEPQKTLLTDPVQNAIHPLSAASLDRILNLESIHTHGLFRRPIMMSDRPTATPEIKQMAKEMMESVKSYK